MFCSVFVWGSLECLPLNIKYRVGGSSKWCLGGFQEIKTDESGSDITLTYCTGEETKDCQFEINYHKLKEFTFPMFIIINFNYLPGFMNISWGSESVLHSPFTE